MKCFSKKEEKKKASCGQINLENWVLLLNPGDPHTHWHIKKTLESPKETCLALSNAISQTYLATESFPWRIHQHWTDAKKQWSTKIQ